MIKYCLICKKSFTTKKSHYARRKYCSRKCSDIAKINHELRKCSVCATEFKFYKSTKGATGKFCSPQCKGIGLRKARINKRCAFCKRDFQPDITYEQKRFCSNKCRGDSMKGKVKPSFWEVASPEKQFERLRKSFEKYVVKSKNGCWGWKGSLAKKYPSLQYGGKYKSIGAHRASWLIYKGAIPKDMYICHSCDNPVCTNPDHLFIGTPSDNVVDMIKKRRNRPPKGENAPGAKLKECEVIEIKKLLKTNMSMAAIAKIFNVAVPTIFDIKENKTWRHIII